MVPVLADNSFRTAVEAALGVPCTAKGGEGGLTIGDSRCVGPASDDSGVM